MLKFFRRIRQKLLTENKFNKYLLYALGEIFLVVIGILIALSINTWNQNRLNKEKETEILTGVKDELYGLIARLDFWAGFNRTGERLTHSVLSFDRANADRRIMDSLFSSILYVNVFDKGGGFLETLINDRKLEFITDDALRTQLSSWPDMLEDLHTNDLSIRGFVWHEFVPFLSEHGIPEFSCERDQAYCFKNEPIPESYLSILENKQFKSLLRHRNTGYMMLANDHEAKSAEAKKTLELINEYLADNL